MRLNLEQHARRVLAYSSGTRFFCSKTQSSPARIQTLQNQIEASINQNARISPVFDQWRHQQQQQGNQLNPSLVRGIVEKLQDSKRFNHALEASDWMIEQKICNLIPEDFTARFRLIENVLGFEEAEKFFESIPENLRSESIYTSLLASYERRSEVINLYSSYDLGKAESAFKKMRELGLLLRPEPYRLMTSLYSSFGNREKVDDILLEMKESNMELDSFTANKALRVYAAASDVATMDKFLAEWEEITILEWPTALDMAKPYLRGGAKEKARDMLHRTEKARDFKSYEELMKLYGEAGEKEDVYRMWDMHKNTRKINNEGFRALIGALLKLNDIKEAEKIYYTEWERSALEFDIRIPNMLVSAYREKGMVEKADKLMKKTMRNREFGRPITPLLEDMGKKGNEVKPSDLRDLIKNLRDSNQFSKALEASSWMGEKRVFNVFPEDYAARLRLTENVLGLEEAEKFFKISIPENMKSYSVYATLLTSYTKSETTEVKAKAVFKKMRELGFLSKLSPFNSMISLYTELRKARKVEELLREMKEKNIEPDSLTINNVLKLYADLTDIETMDKYKRKWFSADEKTKLEVRTRDAMAKAYERASLIPKAIEITGSESEVSRLWNLSDRGDEAYLSVFNSLLNLDDVKGAEEMYKKWEPKGPEFDYRMPSLLLSRYCKEVDNEVKAREVVESSKKKRRKMEVKLFGKLSLWLSAELVFPALTPSVLWFFVEEPNLRLAWLVSSLAIYCVILMDDGFRKEFDNEVLSG